MEFFASNLGEIGAAEKQGQPLDAAQPAVVPTRSSPGWVAG